MTVRDIKVRQTLKSTRSSLFLYKMKGRRVVDRCSKFTVTALVVIIVL